MDCGGAMRVTKTKDKGTNKFTRKSKQRKLAITEIISERRTCFIAVSLKWLSRIFQQNIFHPPPNIKTEILIFLVKIQN